MKSISYQLVNARNDVLDEFDTREEACAEMLEMMRRWLRQYNLPVPETDSELREAYLGQPLGVIEVRTKFVDRIVPDGLLLTEDMRV